MATEGNPYIAKVELVNFQNHKQTTVRFNEGFNVIVGTSDSGKSAFMRGLIWNLTNYPSGSDFIRIGENEAVSIVEWSNGYTVERRRNKSGTVNKYTLYKEGVALEEYTGFGSSVPTLIQEVTHVRQTDRFNIADQLETAFLLSDTPKTRADTIGNLEELGKIDEQLVISNQDIKATKKEQRENAKQLKLLEKEVAELETKVKQNEGKANMLVALKNSILEKTRLVSDLNRAESRLNEIQNELEHLKVQVRSSTRIIENWNPALEKDVQQVTRMTEIANRLTEIKIELQRISFLPEETLGKLIELQGNSEKEVKAFQELQRAAIRFDQIHSEKEKVMNSFSGKVSQMDYSALDKDVEKFRMLFTYSKRIDEIETSKNGIEEDVRRAINQIDELLTQFTDMLHKEEICPTCAQSTCDVTKHQVETLI